MNRKDYKEKWKKLSPIVVKMIKKDGRCNHKLNDTFYFKNPYEKPKGLCGALVHVLDLYTWRVQLGFPSWEKNNDHIYKIHCPSKNGTVWEMKKAKKIEYEKYISSQNEKKKNKKQITTPCSRPQKRDG
jgi:uncharacterized repeat protein (TIGR04076 family)